MLTPVLSPVICGGGAGAFAPPFIVFNADIVGNPGAIWLGMNGHDIERTAAVFRALADERVHDLLGVDSQRFAMLYGLSVGGPVDDARLVTLEAYAHLAEGAPARGGAS